MVVVVVATVVAVPRFKAHGAQGLEAQVGYASQLDTIIVFRSWRGFPAVAVAVAGSARGRRERKGREERGKDKDEIYLVAGPSLLGD